jgi:hypothetical protein
MSHIVEEKTSIVNPDTTLLQQAAQLVAGQYGGTVETHYLDYTHRRHRCLHAIHTPDLERGIGLNIDAKTGMLIFVGDSWMVKEAYQQVQQEVVQTYVALGYMQALQAVGYTASAVEGVEPGQVVIQGVQYA